MSIPPDLDPATELSLIRGFGEVAPEAIAELATLVVQRRLHAQELITSQGQIAPALALLVRGAAKVVRTTTTGEAEVVRVLDVMRASAIVPDPSVFDGTASDASVVTLRASHVFMLEKRGLQKTMRSYPSLERALFSRFLREARNYVHRIDELASGPVEERVHRLLEGLALQHGTPLGHGRFIALPLRRKDLASMVNATTETVSRLLAQLERDGRVRSTRDGIWWRTPAKRATAVPDKEKEVPPLDAEAPRRQPG